MTEKRKAPGAATPEAQSVHVSRRDVYRYKSIVARRRRRRNTLAAMALVVVGLAGSIALAKPEAYAAQPETPAAVLNAQVQEAPPARYSLTQTQRELIEATVMAEAAYEPFAGQMAVAQCILNGCEELDIPPEETVRVYQYAAPSGLQVTGQVEDAVSAVFDKGYTVTEESILFFYSPRWMEGGTSPFHESQRFVVEIGGHRFFALKDEA